jgi:hypothetical protein
MEGRRTRGKERQRGRERERESRVRKKMIYKQHITEQFSGVCVKRREERVIIVIEQQRDK